MSGSNGQALIVGGGVVGAACAYYLNQAGWQVTVLDRGPFGKGCSHGNCGFVCPSHVLPLAMPGAIRPALQALLSPKSPFTIKPRFDMELWSWLFRFARRCKRDYMLEAARAIQALLNSSRTLYDQLLQNEPLDCEWQPRGLLFVFKNQAAMEHYAETDQLLRTSFNLAAIRYDADALLELEPALKPEVAGGWHYQADGHLRPDKLMAAWRRVLEARGVTILEHQEVTGFVGEHGCARAVVTAQGELPADAVVVATGALTPQLGPQLGSKIPIQPGKGYSITMPRPARCPALPMIFEEHRVAVTPMQSAYRLGSTMEFAGYDDRLNPKRLNLLLEGARHYLQEPECEPVLEQWCGWRPMTYDSLPIIGPSRALKNVLLAAGHGMLGLSMAPATGRLVAELISGDPPHIDPAPYALSRF